MGKLSKEKIDDIYRMLDDSYSYKEIMAKVGCSKPTLVRYLGLRKKGNKESVAVADNVITKNLDEEFKLIKNLEIFKYVLLDTKSWLDHIEADDADAAISNELIGLYKQLEFLQEKVGEKNIDSAGLEKLYKLKNDVVVDGNRIIKVLNEKRKRKEEEELKRLEREKKEELERRKKEEEDSRQRSLERQTERYCSRPMGERQRMILRDGGVREQDDQDSIIMEWLHYVRHENPEHRMVIFKSFLEGLLSEVPRVKYDYILYWWERVCMK